MPPPGLNQTTQVALQSCLPESGQQTSQLCLAGSSKTPRQPGPLDPVKKLNECIDNHFEENNTQVKAAIYHLSKNESQEGRRILERVLRLNKTKQQQMAFHIKNLTMRSAALEQSVHGLQRWEAYLLSSQAKLQEKVDTFCLNFEDDIEEPEEKRCKKGFLKVETRQKIKFQTKRSLTFLSYYLD